MNPHAALLVLLGYRLSNYQGTWVFLAETIGPYEVRAIWASATDSSAHAVAFVEDHRFKYDVDWADVPEDVCASAVAAHRRRNGENEPGSVG